MSRIMSLPLYADGSYRAAICLVKLRASSSFSPSRDMPQLASAMRS